MKTRITATELARNLSDILNRVRYRGESFEVVRSGEIVATLEPPPRKKGVTVREFAEFWASLPPVDEKFADDLEDVHNSQGLLPPPPEWP